MNKDALIIFGSGFIMISLLITGWYFGMSTNKSSLTDCFDLRGNKIIDAVCEKTNKELNNYGIICLVLFLFIFSFLIKKYLLDILCEVIKNVYVSK